MASRFSHPRRQASLMTPILLLKSSDVFYWRRIMYFYLICYGCFAKRLRTRTNRAAAPSRCELTNSRRERASS
jgi:hypothetical protein